jgi:hypothetical protein
MDRLKEGIVRGSFAGKEGMAVMRDKLNEIIDWVNEFEKPVVVKLGGVTVKTDKYEKCSTEKTKI